MNCTKCINRASNLTCDCVDGFVSPGFIQTFSVLMIVFFFFFLGWIVYRLFLRLSLIAKTKEEELF